MGDISEDQNSPAIDWLAIKKLHGPTFEESQLELHNWSEGRSKSSIVREIWRRPVGSCAKFIMAGLEEGAKVEKRPGSALIAEDKLCENREKRG